MRILISAGIIALAGPALAQKPPVVRQIGTLEHVSADAIGFKSISMALAMPGGRVMINDMIGRRVVVLDSTLAGLTVAADTTAATANAYGTSWATLIRYRGDSALLIVPSTLSMFVLGPNGATARVMAVPRPNEAQQLSGAFGTPGLDARGRLIYFHGALPGITMMFLGDQLLQDGQPTELVRRMAQFGEPPFAVGKVEVDSAILLRVDLESRVLDTAARIRVPFFRRDVRVDAAGKLQAIETTPDPLPVIDQWTVLRDGTLAIVRGRDYHVDWIDMLGKRTSSPKIPFEWQRVDDARKTALIDSAVAVWQKNFDDNLAARMGGRSRGGGGGGGAGLAPAPNIATRASLTDLPDYFPPFPERGVTSDLDDNLWVQTTLVLDNRPVYDVINRRGELIDRVQLPRYRTIAGFGRGVIYLAVMEPGGHVRLERARVK